MSEVIDTNSNVTQSNQMVRSSVNYVWDSSKYYYDMIKTRTYGSNSLVKYGFDGLELIAKCSQPIATKLYNYVGEPVITKTDNKVDAIINKFSSIKNKTILSEIKQIIVTNAWVANVNALLSTSIDKTSTINYFLEVTSNTYIDLLQRKDNLKVNYDEYIKAIQMHFNKVWDTTLLQLSKNIYNTMSLKYKPNIEFNFTDLIENLKLQFIDYEQIIFNSLQLYVKNPALAFYNMAIDQYVILLAKTNHTVQPTFDQFRVLIKQRLGNTYSSSLEPYMLELYNTLSQLNSTIKTSYSNLYIQTYMYIDYAGKLTLYSILVENSCSIIQRVGDYVNNKYVNVLNKTANIIDKFIPDEKVEIVEGEKSVDDISSLTLLRSHVTRKLQQKLQSQLQNIKNYSTQQLLLIHSISSSKIKTLTGIDILYNVENILNYIDHITKTTHDKIYNNAYPITNSVKLTADVAYQKWLEQLLKLRNNLQLIKTNILTIVDNSQIKERIESHTLPAINELKKHINQTITSCHQIILVSSQYALHTELNELSNNTIQLVMNSIPNFISYIPTSLYQQLTNTVIAQYILDTFLPEKDNVNNADNDVSKVSE